MNTASKTREALLETRRSGVKPFCITIDSEAHGYLPYLQGPINWTLVNDLACLPMKVPEIYCKLTA